MDIKEAKKIIEEQESRLRILDIVIAHTRWVSAGKRFDQGEFITLLNTLESLRQELESGSPLI